MRVSRASWIVVGLVAVSLAANGWAQQRGERQSGSERLFAIVPMVGAGTFGDPKRPAYVPDYLVEGQRRKPGAVTSPLTEAQAKREVPRAIVGFRYELSDDGQFALVAFEASHRAAFEPLLQAARTPQSSRESGANRNALDGGYDLKVFEVGKSKASDIEREFRKYKQAFSSEAFGGRR